MVDRSLGQAGRTGHGPLVTAVAGGLWWGARRTRWLLGPWWNPRIDRGIWPSYGSFPRRNRMHGENHNKDVPNVFENDLELRKI